MLYDIYIMMHMMYGLYSTSTKSTVRCVHPSTASHIAHKSDIIVPGLIAA